MTARGKDKIHSVVTYLLSARESCDTPVEAEPYDFSIQLFRFLKDGWLQDPWRAVFVYRYGKHPEYVIPIWLRREAEHKTLYWSRRDATVEPAVSLRRPAKSARKVYAMQKPEKPSQQEPLRKVSAAGA